MRVLRHLAAGARDTRLAVGEDAVLLDEPRAQRRHERERHGRRVAAGVRDEALAADLVAEQLRQAVHGLLVQLGV